MTGLDMHLTGRDGCDSWADATKRTPQHDSDANAAYKRARTIHGRATNAMAHLAKTGKDWDKVQRDGRGSRPYRALLRIVEEQEDVIEAARAYSKLTSGR